MHNIEKSNARMKVIEHLNNFTDEEFIQFLIYLKKEIEENEEYACLKEVFFHIKKQ